MRSRSRVASLLVVLLGVVSVLGGVTGASAAEPVDCDLTVVRVYFAERATVDAIASWTEPWEVRYDLGYLVVGVNPDGFVRLASAGYDLEVDEKLTEQVCTPPQALPDQVEGIPGYPCYRTVEETYQAAQDLVAARPDLASLVDVGDSWEKVTAGGLPGYDLLVLKLTNSNVAGTPTGTEPPHGKPKFLITAAIHAREYTTAELAIRFAEGLVNGHGTDADATWLLDEHEIHILLHANPDGRKHAEAGSLWRKNTNQDYCGPTDPDRGADLNRNFEYQWAACPVTWNCSSNNQCDETFHGSMAASEPETQAVEAYARAIFPDQKGPNPTDPVAATATGVYVDIHSYSERVLWAWGFTSTVPPNGSALQTLGRRLAYFNGYEPSQSIGLYPTDGTTVDFAFGDLGVAAYTFELGTSFFQSCSTFESTILPDNLESLRYFAKVARTPYLTPGGPSVTSVLSPSGTVIVAPGEPVEARAVVDDLPFNNTNGTEPTQNITAAEVYVDSPPWQAGATPLAMAPADGAFNTKTETAVTTVATTGLAEGRHTLFFRGQDASGAWGPVTAALFWVLDPGAIPHIAGTVTELGTGLPLAATVTAGAASTSTNPADGSYDLMVLPGTYTVTAAAPDHGMSTQGGVVATPGATTSLDFLLAPYTTILSDTVESGNIGWTAQAPWAITAESSASPTHSWTDSPGGSYANNRNVSLTSPLLDLSGYGGVRLEFQHTYATESGYDYCHVEYSTDNGSTWTTVTSYDGTEGSWQLVDLDLGALDGVAQARIRFRLETDFGVTADGWHVDDILVRGAVQVEQGYIFGNGFESGTTDAWSSVLP